MRNRVVWLMAALLIGFVASGPSQAQQITNLFQNPGFETGALAPWGSYGGGGATVTSTVVKDCVGANVPEGPDRGDLLPQCEGCPARGTNYLGWRGIADSDDRSTGRFRRARNTPSPSFSRARAAPRRSISSRNWPRTRGPAMARHR